MCAARKKSTAKKATKKAEKKPASKAAKKAVKQVPNNSEAVKSKDTPPAIPTKDDPSIRQPLKEIATKRGTSNTPAVFKVPNKKHTPVVFSLEEVRDVLKAKKIDEKKVEPTAKKEAKATGTKKVESAPKAESVETKGPRMVGAASLADILGFNPAQPSKPTQNEANQVPKKWKHYYDLLVELRYHVKEELDEHAKETLKRSNKEDSGDLSSYGQHMADAGSDNFDRDFALSMLSTEQEALKEIEDAIQRILRGNYGICEITGQKIAPERLEAVPFTRFSVEGQVEYERNNRRKSNRGGNAFLDADESVAIPDEDADE